MEKFNITKLHKMEEQLDYNLSIYCLTTNDNISVLSGDEWDKSDAFEKILTQSIN